MGGKQWKPVLSAQSPWSEPEKDERQGGVGVKGCVLRSVEVGIPLRICLVSCRSWGQYGFPLMSGPFILGRVGVMSTRIKAQKQQLVTGVKLAFCASRHSLQWRRAVTPQAVLKEGRVVWSWELPPRDFGRRDENSNPLFPFLLLRRISDSYLTQIFWSCFFFFFSFSWTLCLELSFLIACHWYFWVKACSAGCQSIFQIKRHFPSKCFDSWQKIPGRAMSFSANYICIWVAVGYGDL